MTQLRRFFAAAMLASVLTVSAFGDDGIIHTDRTGIIHTDGTGIIHTDRTDNDGIIHTDRTGIIHTDKTTAATEVMLSILQSILPLF